LQRRWLLALALGLLLAPAAGVGAWFLLSAKYTAFTQLHIAMVPPWLVSRTVDGGGDRNEFSTYQKTQAARIKGRLVLSAALARDEVKRLGLVQEQADPLAWLEEEIKVDFQEGNEILTVSLSGSEAGELLALVDGVTKAYEQQIVQAEREKRARRVEEMDKLVAQTTSQLRSDRDSLHRLVNQLETSDSQVLTQRQLYLMGDLADKKKHFNQTRFELMNARRRLEAHKAQEALLKEAPVSESVQAEVLETDPITKAGQLRLEKLRELIAEFQHASLRPNDQRLVRAQRQYQQEERLLESRRAELKTNLVQRSRHKTRSDYDIQQSYLQSEVEVLAALEKDLAKEVEGLEEKVKKIGGNSSTELEMLRAQIDQRKKYLEQVGSDLELLRAEQNSPPRVSLLQAAALQKKDIKRPVLGAVGAPILVLLLVALGVALVEFRSRRICTADEVASGLGIRVVGAVPPLRRQTAQGIQEVLVESIDALRTVLLRDAHLEATRVVMVTSASQGEGKTTLACNLADSLARAGRKTLLLDCDLRQPLAHQLFELPLQPGFSEILLGEVDAADTIQATPVPGLFLVPAGQWDREVVQALAREGVGEIFEKLKEEYDFIVIDSHPVLNATDSLLLGQHADAVLLSVLREVSRSPRVYSACQRLASLGIRLLGAVVNGAAPDEVYANAQAQPMTAGRS
jgi:capsular exopolysaccharide synthesis family protein